VGPDRATMLCCLLALSGCQSLASGIENRLKVPTEPVNFSRTVDLAPPTALRVTATSERQISLAWDPVLVGDVAGYAILRSTSASGPYAPAGRVTSRFQTLFTDPGNEPERLGDGTTLHYRVHPVDSKGAPSRSHAYIAATTDPRPSPPAGLRSYSNLPRMVVLSWEPNASTAIEGYAILRSPTVAGSWERIAYAAGRLNTVYEDPVPGDLRVMYYRMQAVNHFGGQSDMTQPVRAVTKADPLPPIGLRVSGRRLGQAQLVWSPNVESDLRSYEVFRAEQFGGTWIRERRIGAVATPETELTDAQLGCGQRVRYRLQAIDADGLRSAFSRGLEVTGLDLDLKVVRKGQDLELHWDLERASSWPHAVVTLVRRALPDRVLARVDADGPASLQNVPPGNQRLAVTLLDASPGGPQQAISQPAPPCEIEAQIPAIARP